MDLSSKKLELLDWLMHINDSKLLMKVDNLKKQLSSEKQKQPVFGRLKGKIKIAPDFNAPLGDFKEYEP